MENLKWYMRPLRIGAIQWNQYENSYKVPELLSDGGFNTEQLLHAVAGDGCFALFDNGTHGEKLKKYIGESKERGTKIILYFNAHMIEKDTYIKFPGWSQQNKSNKPEGAYDTYILACVNSEWREAFLNTIKDALKYDIDGIFLDGPFFSTTGCYCEACKSLFHEIYDCQLEDASSEQLIKFKTDSIARFVKDVRSCIDESGREVILYANSQGLTANITGCDVDAIYPYVDFLGTEGGFLFYNDPNRVFLWKGSQNAKYLESKAKGKPCVIFAAGDHKPWSFYMHSASESRLLFASAVANGANVWYGIHGPIEVLSTPGGKAAYDFNRFLKVNEEYYTCTKKHAEIALLWSKETINTFPEDVEKSDFTVEQISSSENERGSFLNEFRGFYDILTRNHFQFSIIDEKYLLDGDLCAFKAVVLPNTSCIGPDAKKCIEGFVKNGGTIISSMASSFYDEKGNKLEAPALAEAMGISSVEEVVSYKSGCSYLEVGDKEWFGEGVSASMTAGMFKAVKCSYNDGVEVLASMHEPMSGRYSSLPAETYPSVTAYKFGEGQSIYISGNIGETYMRFGAGDLKRILANIFLRYTDSFIKTNGLYETVEVEVREQADKNRILIHFVNYTGSMHRPVEDVILCRNAEITLNTSKEVVSVYSLYERRQELDFIKDAGKITFIVPVIEEYQLVVVEYNEKTSIL